MALVFATLGIPFGFVNLMITCFIETCLSAEQIGCNYWKLDTV